MLMVEALQEQIQLRRRTGFDADGEPTFADAVTVYCRWSEMVQEIRGRTGEQIITMCEVWVRPETVVDLGDVLVRNGVEFTVQMVSAKTDIGSQPAYLKVYV